MLDPAFFRDNLDAVRDGLRRRGVDLGADVEELAALEASRRRLLPEIEGLKREQNAAGEELARARRQGLDTSAAQEAGRARAQRIKEFDAELEQLEARRSEAMLAFPERAA